MPSNALKGKLVLEDGSVFSGISFGFDCSKAGEVVFNTGMVGYPESLTDPSYNGQILVFSYPLIGNYGVPDFERKNSVLKNFESDSIQVSGLIVSDYSFQYSHHSATKSLSEWLKENRVPALCGIDTRRLTQKLREHGTMLGKIVLKEDTAFIDPNKRNLVSEVSIQKPLYHKPNRSQPSALRVLLIDCGVKNSIISSLLERNVEILRVPWNNAVFSPEHKFDAILVSNGPGNPKMCEPTIAIVRKAIKKRVPVLGICLGSQILALAAGADTFKLKYGHRSQNQPCTNLETGKCYITSQNHGYAVDTKSLPREWHSWFENANDGTNEGIKHDSELFLGVQFHPEASPGPTDTAFLFDEFFEVVRNEKKNA